MKVVKSAERIAARRANGLKKRWFSSSFRKCLGISYFLVKWGIIRSPGIIKKAGKVIRLKIPKTTTNARIAEAKAEDRCCAISAEIPISSTRFPYLILHDPINQYQTPSHRQGLYRVWERMCLICPCNIWWGYQHNCDPSMPRWWNQFMKSPILQHKTQGKHQHS